MAAAERIVVKFRPTGDTAADSLRELCDQVGRMTNATLVRPPSHSGRAVFQVPVSSDLDHLIEEIRKLPSVEYAEKDAVDRAQM
jgi:hypothetical protein